METNSQNPIERLDQGRQHGQTEQVMSQNLIVEQQPSNLILGQVEDASLFQRMGLKRNASEGSSSRAQRPTKRTRRQAGPSGRARRSGCKGNVVGTSAANDD
ncbi:hypothetical protein ACFX13_028355 [Malus domestica]